MSGGERIRILLLLVASMLPIGCQEPDRSPEAPRVISNVYGLTIVVDLRDATGAEEYYMVDADGMFGFGGGLDARFERTSYTAALTADDMQQLADVIREQRLVEQRLESTNQPEDVRYRIMLRTSDGKLKRTLRGEQPRIEALRQVLRAFANRRLSPELDRQPQPSAGQHASPTTPDQ